MALAQGFRVDIEVCCIKKFQKVHCLGAVENYGVWLLVASQRQHLEVGADLPLCTKQRSWYVALLVEHNR